MKSIFIRIVRRIAIIMVAIYLLTHYYWAWHPRFWQLQVRGSVAENAMIPFGFDWRVAPQTWWWGRPLDPKKFWSGRIIWNDWSAQYDAMRHGRQYPPIPTHVPSLVAGFPLSSYSHVDRANSSMGLPDSGPSIPTHFTDVEHAYWDWFWRTKPNPPVQLEDKILRVAQDYLCLRKPADAESRSLQARLPLRLPVDSEEGFGRREREIGVPEEVMTDEGLFWAYVMKQRSEYDRWLKEDKDRQSRGSPPAGLAEAAVLSGCKVDAKLITEPLTKAQLDVANAWKIAYLQRLLFEGVSVSYIQAYMSAWQISKEALCATPNLNYRKMTLEKEETHE